MPDSFPPFGWGPAPFDERDLDALLSGGTAEVPDGLRQVADALAALRAAPTLAELSGESTIMAEFSALAEFRALGLSQATRDDGQAHTLVLPVQPGGPAGSAGPARRRGARHRSRRPYPVSRRAGALLVSAAAALTFGAVAVTGSLPGTGHGHSSTAASASASQSGPNSASPNLQGKGATQETSPSHHPQAGSRQAVPPPANATTPTALCHALFGFVQQSGQDWRAKLTAEASVLRRLDKLAHGLWRVPGYCARLVHEPFPNELPWPYGRGSHLPPDPDQGSQGQQPGPGQPGPSANPAPAASSNSGSTSPSGRWN